MEIDGDGEDDGDSEKDPTTVEFSGGRRNTDMQSLKLHPLHSKMSIGRGLNLNGLRDINFELVEQMKKERHRPTPQKFMPIIHGFAKVGETKRALEVFNLMKRAGYIPTVHTYNALVLGLADKTQETDGKSHGILDEMSLAGVIPVKPFEYFSKVREEGLQIDVYAHKALLKVCCKAGRMQSALTVTRDMSAQKIPRNTFVYKILIDVGLEEVMFGIGRLLTYCSKSDEMACNPTFIPTLLSLMHAARLEIRRYA